VLARWAAPHELHPAEAEVAEVVYVRLSTLTDPDAWRAVRLSASGWSWAWQLDRRNLLWGATGVVTSELLDVLAPGWHGGRTPEELGATREVAPWDTRDRGVPKAGPPRLPGVPERPVDDLATLVGERPDDLGLPGVAAAGTVAADAVRRLLARARAGARRRILVLAGAGGNGRAGLDAARRLAHGGDAVEVAVARWSPAAEALNGELGGRVRAFTGTLPEADVVLDALVGGGLRGRLGGDALGMLLALRHQIVPVLALDLPSGLHPDDGLVGDVLPADVTLALGAPRRGLFHPGLAPFVGDVYVAAFRADEPPLVRLVPGPRRLREAVGSRGGRWRE
jgi:NAD(P)H-hydrate repair Nnr-like enzyme with NAD(P)H-hydrate epimerase domain